MQQTKYCAGFAFGPDDTVVLIQKTKPKWQAGKFNGIGGKIEPNESPAEAQVREFEEETGVKITNWKLFATVIYPEATVYFHKTTIDLRELNNLHSVTEELVKPFWIYSLPLNLISNLRWLIPLALDSRNENYTISVNDWENPIGD